MTHPEGMDDDDDAHQGNAAPIGGKSTLAEKPERERLKRIAATMAGCAASEMRPHIKSTPRRCWRIADTDS